MLLFKEMVFLMNLELFFLDKILTMKIMGIIMMIGISKFLG